MRIKQAVIVAGSVLAVTLSAAGPVLAVGPPANAHDPSPAGQPATRPVQPAGQPSNPGNQGNNNQSGKPGNPGSQAGAKLAGAQLKACQNRQAAVNNILNRIVTRGQGQLTLFNTIAQRVEAFATSKSITVNNYNQLVSTLQADQTKAANDLAAMKTSGTFDCANPDPKGIVSAFQADLKQEISDLQTYRTDVKNLIVAVKTAAESANSGSSNTNTGTNPVTSGGNKQ